MSEKTKTCYSGIGGQAVLEGVMMKNGENYAVAIRRQNKEIVVEKDVYVSKGGKEIQKIPFVRGVFMFLDSMILGIRCINLSADYFAEEEEPEKEAQQDEGDDKKKSSESALATGLTIALSVVLAVGLFMLLPYFLSRLIGRFTDSAALIAVMEGIFRILIFLGYMTAISLMKDIHRLYQYHGAEHKCINCIESGRPLTVENARNSSRFHKRCGTSFIFLVVLVSIIIFFFIRVESPLWRVLLRLLLLPVISGISYELIRWAGRSDFFLIQWISQPGLWTQRITTKEPDDSMLEVAIASVEAVFDWKKYQSETFS